MAMVLVVEEKPTYWQLSVSGELGYAECSEFRLSVHRILMSLTRVTLVDMSGIEYVDSSGLGILVAMSREYVAAGGRLILVTNPTVDGLLRLSGLDRVFETATTREEAVRALEGESSQSR